MIYPVLVIFILAGNSSYVKAEETSFSAQRRVACSTKKGGMHWAWREIDGRRCWYQGRRGKSKNILYWPKPFVPTPPPVPIPIPKPKLDVWSGPSHIVYVPKIEMPIPDDEHELLESIWPRLPESIYDEEEITPIQPKIVQTTREKMKEPTKLPSKTEWWLSFLGLTKRRE